MLPMAFSILKGIATGPTIVSECSGGTAGNGEAAGEAGGGPDVGEAALTGDDAAGGGGGSVAAGVGSAGGGGAAPGDDGAEAAGSAFCAYTSGLIETAQRRIDVEIPSLRFIGSLPATAIEMHPCLEWDIESFALWPRYHNATSR